MAEIRNVMTTAGKNLITSSMQASKPIVFVYAKVGTGGATYKDKTSAWIAQNVTALKTPFVRNATIKKRSIQGGNSLIISVQFSNKDPATAATSSKDVTTAIYINEVGVYAKLQGQNDSAAILFSYMNFGDQPDLMLGTDTAVVNRVYDIPYVFSGDSTAEVTISSSAMVTEDDLAASGGAGLAGKIVKLNADGKLDVDITGDANTLDGHDSAYFLPATHITALSGNTANGSHPVATTSAHGFMDKADKVKMNTMTSTGTVQLLTQSASPTFKGLNLSNGYIDNAKFR